MSINSTNPYLNIEQKWQKLWYDHNVYGAKDNDHTRPKKYILEEFPYPSGAKLHIGHCFRYTAPDVYSKFLRMQGYNVLFPIGWDAFGLPAEEYARKTGINPKVVTKENIANFKAQLQSLGFGFDWAREFATTDPDYYKWTQWIFGELYKAGLAEQKEVELWWCENLATVLANEEIIEIDGKKVSERGEYPVEKKKMKQWILKMPEYAEELLDGLDQTNFPHNIKEMQRNWIGKSEGVIVDWQLKKDELEKLEVDPEKIPVLESEFEQKLSAVADKSGLFGSVLFINPDGQVLIMKRSANDDGAGLWDLPGGSVESGETVLEGAKREGVEETGIEAQGLNFIDHYTFELEEKDCNCFIFYTQTDKTPVLNDEHDEYRWVSYKDAVDLLWNDNMKQAVTKLFETIFPVFADKPENIDYQIPFGERSLALIKIKETGEFVVYDKALRNDFRVRFPGGHIDPGENSLVAAIREVTEEAGLSNLEYIGKLGTSHGFYDWAPDTATMVHKLDHFHYFECSLKDWENRKAGIEDHISCFLATEEYVREKAVRQFLVALNNIEKIKTNYQKNTLQTFTTRVDTLFSVTFLVLAPENPKVLEITTPEQLPTVQNYIAQTKNLSDLDRQIGKEKTGVFTGSYVIHPLTGEHIPVWISDFVLPGYGTGCVMADAHDERDFELATKYNIPLKETIAPEYGESKPNEVFVEGVGLVVFNPETQLYGYISNRDFSNYTLIGGGMEKGESPRESARRELEEETGLSDIHEIIDLNRPFYSHYFNQSKQINRVALTHPQLVILNSDKTIDARPEAHENFELKWATPEEIISKIDQINNSHQIEFVKLGVRRAIESGFDITNSLEKYPLSVVTDDGILYDSAEFSGLHSSEARSKIAQKLASLGKGKKQINYKFRDWVFSRQRYWGEPFPFEYIKKTDTTKSKHTTTINGEEYEIHLLGKDKLPLELPDVADFQPANDGRSPLAKSDWATIKDESGQVVGMHEVDTMPQWAGSSWYYLRYTDPKNTQEFASQENLKYWLPVDHYFGGSEHTTLHLLYSRFWHKVLYDLGHVPTPEPYANRTNGGLMLAADGTKMSKSKGNVVNPDEKIEVVGADAMRLYMSFIGPLEATVVWQDGGLIACKRLVDSLFRSKEKVDKELVATDPKTLATYHQMLKKVTEHLENMRNNVAVAEIMTFNNFLKDLEVIPGDIWTGYLQVLAPFASHVTEELWYDFHDFDQSDYTKSIHTSSWPKYDPELAKNQEVVIAVQVNGKVRATFEAAADSEDDIILEKAKQEVTKWLEGKEIKFSKVVKNKLVSIVV
jgi:mutator protein MutT